MNVSPKCGTPCQTGRREWLLAFKDAFFRKNAASRVRVGHGTHLPLTSTAAVVASMFSAPSKSRGERLSRGSGRLRHRCLGCCTHARSVSQSRPACDGGLLGVSIGKGPKRQLREKAPLPLEAVPPCFAQMPGFVTTARQ